MVGKEKESLFSLRAGDRCPGCGVQCVALDVEHLDNCAYIGKLRLVQPYPKKGDVWRSRDKRDQGLTVTVLEVDKPFGRVQIKRFNKTSVSIARWLKDYAFVSRVAE